MPKCWEINQAMAVALDKKELYERDEELCMDVISDMFIDEPIETAQKLVRGLMSMAFIAKSPLTETTYQGFGEHISGGDFNAIVKQEYKPKVSK